METRMTRSTLLLSFGLLVLLTSATKVHAQLPFQDQVGDTRPQLSPYLQLLNLNPQTGISNYLTIGRDQIDQNRITQQQQSQINNLQRQQQKLLQPTSNIATRGATTIRGTGHDSLYSYSSH